MVCPEPWGLMVGEKYEKPLMMDWNIISLSAYIWSGLIGRQSVGRDDTSRSIRVFLQGWLFSSSS
jgi:hypothetical protein